MSQSKFTDPQHLRSKQYKFPDNLNARYALHVLFSTNAYSWMRWLFDQLEIPPQAKILDLGSGPGVLWVENKDRIPDSWQITLMDISEGMVADVRRELGGGSYHYGCCNAQDLPFPDNSFDTILANHMLYHVPDLSQSIREISRILKPEGVFYAATNGPTHMVELFNMIEEYAPQANYQRTHVSFDLENGREWLYPVFKDTEKREYPTGLKITQAEPLAAYILSMSSLEDYGINEDPDALVAYIQNILNDQGVILISKSVGVIIGKNY